MKRITLLLVLSLLFEIAKATYPQTLPIDYPQFFKPTAIGVNPALENGIYTSGTATINPNAWNRSGKLTAGEGGGVSPVVEASTLNYSSYIDNNAGKAILLDPNIAADPNVASSTFRTSVYSLTTLATDYVGTFYAGMLINFSAVAGSGVDFFGFDSNYTGNAQRGRIFIKASANAGYYNVGIGFSGVSDIPTAAWSQDLAIGTTYFVVAKINVAATGTESNALYVNPGLGILETSATPLSNYSTTFTAALKSIKGLVIRQRPGIGGKIAGIRFSNNWSDVVKSGMTQANAPTVSSATNITGTSFTANWSLPSTNNALSYNILLYQGSTLLSTTNVSNATTSAVISGLTAGLTYTYKVVAKGDGTTLADSDPVTSTTFTSAIPSISGAAVITGTSFNAVWTPVSNATGYSVLVYQGADLLSTTSISGQASSVALISGLSEGLLYTYKVTTSAGFTSDLSPSFIALKPYVKEIFSDWTDQVAGPLNVTKKLFDGTTDGTFTGLAIVVSSTAGIGGAGIIDGNGNPSIGRISFNDATAYLQLPQLPTVGQINIKSNVGTDNSGFKLQTWDGTTATDIPNTLTSCAKLTTKLFTFNLAYNSAKTIRIMTNQSGSVNLWDVQVNPYVAIIPPKLSIPTVGSASDILATSFTAKWTKVDNALGYYVKIYQGTTLVGTNFASGQGTESLTIIGLLPSTSYTYKVVAKGDAITNFSSSDDSASASATTTADLGTGLNQHEISAKLKVTAKTVSVSEAGDIQIYNLQGSLVFHAKSVNTINTNLASGLYIVNFTNKDGKNIIQKITIK